MTPDKDPTKDLRDIPTGMETDPKADREVIDQQAGEQYPKEAPQPEEPNELRPDNLRDAIAYALDGSGPGLPDERTD